MYAAKITFLVLFPLYLNEIFCQDEDLYKVLGVRQSATPEEIKKAYKSLAKEWYENYNNCLLHINCSGY